MNIKTEQGSATSAVPTKHGVVIAHLANNVGRWGAGFVLALNDLSVAARNAYRAFCKDHNDNVPLGTTQFVEVRPNLWVANMMAQNGVDKSVVPDGCLVDYQALNTCLATTFERAVRLGCHVHIPSGMGSGLAGGSEQMIHDLIKTRAICSSIEEIEQQMDFVPDITLWEFQDATATSYVGQPRSVAATAVQAVIDVMDLNTI